MTFVLPQYLITVQFLQTFLLPDLVLDSDRKRMHNNIGPESSLPTAIMTQFWEQRQAGPQGV